MPVLPHVVSSVMIILFVAASVLSFFKRKKRTFSSLFFILCSSLFFAYVVSLIYSIDINYAFKKLSTALPLIVVPLSFSFLSPGQLNYCKEHLKDYLKIYITSVVVLLVLSTAGLLVDNTFSELFNESKNFYHNLNVLYGMDTLYLSFHISIAVLFSTYLFYISRKVWKAIIAAILVILFFGILLFLSFKASLIAVILSFGILSVLTNKVKLWILSGAGLTLLISAIVFSPQVNERFSQLLVIKNNSIETLNSNEIRANLNACSIELLPKAGLIGYGIGDGKEQLTNCFSSMDGRLAGMSYNSHNQYISIVMNVGFLGLILFLGSLFINCIISLNKKNYLAVTTVVLMAIWMLAENILERQGGVMYFALFTSFLFVLNFKEKKQSSNLLSHEIVMESINK